MNRAFLSRRPSPARVRQSLADTASTITTCRKNKLHVDRPSKFGELFLDIGQRQLQCGAAMRVRRPLRQHTFTLQLQSLELALVFRCLGVEGGWAGSRLNGLRLLFFHGFTLPSSRHITHSTPPDVKRSIDSPRGCRIPGPWTTLLRACGVREETTKKPCRDNRMRSSVGRAGVRTTAPGPTVSHADLLQSTAHGSGHFR